MCGRPFLAGSCLSSYTGSARPAGPAGWLASVVSASGRTQRAYKRGQRPSREYRVIIVTAFILSWDQWYLSRRSQASGRSETERSAGLPWRPVAAGRATVRSTAFNLFHTLLGADQCGGRILRTTTEHNSLCQFPYCVRWAKRHLCSIDGCRLLIDILSTSLVAVINIIQGVWEAKESTAMIERGRQ